MAQNLETMFKARQPVWEQIGRKTDRALTSAEVLRQGGLDWSVVQESVYADGKIIPNCKANVRDSDKTVLGIVSDRYQVIQNSAAFSFIDELIGEGVKFENVGSLQNGRRCFILAKLPEKYFMAGERIDPYLVFCNSHDGSLALTIFMTPIRIVCMNQMNLALKKAKRSWSAKHVGDIKWKLHEANETLSLAHNYMGELGKEIDVLNKIKLTDSKVMALIHNELAPYPDNATAIQKKNVNQIREDMTIRYFDAPDLKSLPKNAYRFVNAISDHATHSTPIRQTAAYNENLFMRTMDGLVLLDKAHNLVKAAA